MRIVHVDDLFFPDSGYQLNILSKYMAKAGHEVVIITSELEKIPAFLTDFFGKTNVAERDAAFSEATGVKIIRVPIYTFYSGRSIYKPGMFKLIDGLKPDVLYVHCEDTYFGIRAILRLHKFGYPVLFDDHMVDIASENRFAPIFRLFYRKVVTPRLVKQKSTVIRVVDDDFIFRRYGIPREQGPLVGFGSDLIHFHPDDAKRSEVRKDLDISSEDFVIVYAGKMDESKGGQLLADALVEPLETTRAVTFLVIGSFSGPYGTKVRGTLEKSKNHVVMLPTQPYASLARYFQCADAAVFPKQCSLTYYDVQACGLPVVLEDNVIGVGRVTHNNGLLFKAGDVVDLRDKMAALVNLDQAKFVEMRKSSFEHIEKNYNYRSIVEQYLQIIMNVCERFESNKVDY